MNNFPNNLELAEYYAADNNLIGSEQALSDLFDETVLPAIVEAHAIPGELFEDTVMVNEAFNNWSDALCKDGQLHESQYSTYCYVGAMS